MIVQDKQLIQWFPLVALLLLRLATLGSSFPIGINLTPLGGTKWSNNFININMEGYSTYAFINIFKHCGDPYVRSVGLFFIFLFCHFLT
jgi:hypothetical protein